MTGAANIDRLLRPKSVAIVGASPKPASPGSRVLAGLTQFGFPGAIHLVNPGRTELGGRPCVPRVDDLPAGVDLAVLCIPKDAILDALEACARRRIGAAVVFAAGFAEQDEDGAALQDRMVAVARAADIALLGPNCLGFINMNGRAPITMATPNPPRGDLPGVGVIAQSGAIMSSLRATFDLKDVATTYLVSVGNQAVLGVEDFVADLIDDEKTHVLAVFVERLREPRRFLELAAHARTVKKPIILMHPGRSGRARAAAQSHTGALAGDHAIMRALTAHEAVILVDTLDELADVSALLCRYPSAPSAGVGVVTNSGAFRGVTFDYCDAVGLDVPETTAATRRFMADRLPPFAVVENPIDLTVQVLQEPELVGIGAKALVDDPNIGSVVLAVHAGREAADYAKHAGRLLADSSKPIAYSILGEGALVSPELIENLRAGGIPLFRSVERALGAVARATAYGRMIRHERGRVPMPARAIAPLPHLGTLAEYRGKQWLKEAGIPVPEGGLAKTVEEARAIAARIAYPIVLKAQSGALAHKSDAGGVILGVGDDSGLFRGWSQLHDNMRQAGFDDMLDGILVERMMPKGIELVLGARRDPDWGPVLLVGFGGIWIEILNDVRLMPVDLPEDAIAEEILKLRGAELLRGARGRPAADIAAVARIGARLGELVRGAPEITEIDINPLMVYPDGADAIALDALVVATSEPPQP